MGRIVVAGMISVDGYMEGKGADLSVMPMDEAFNEHNADRMRSARTLLYGGSTYRQMVGYWPSVPDNPQASPAEQEIAKRCLDGIPIVAVSNTLTEDETGPWREQTTIVKRADAHGAVADLRDQDGDTLIFGSLSVWTDLLAHGLIDDLYLMIGPKLVAGDRRVFAGIPETDLTYVETLTYGDSPNLVLHYEVRRS